MGRVRGQQRRAQGRRRRSGRCDLRATPGPRSCSCSRTTTTSRRRSRTSPTKYTANKIHYADTPAAVAGFQHLQEAFDKGWWQKDFGSRQVRRRPEHAGGRRDRAVPDAELRRSAPWPDEPPRHHQRHRLLRPAGRRRRRRTARPSGCPRPPTSRRPPARATSTRPRTSWRSSHRSTAPTSMTASSHRQAHTSSRAHAAPTVLCRASSTSRPTSTRNNASGPRVPVAGQGPEPGADHGRGRLGPHVRGGRRRPVRPGRREAGQAAQPAGLVSRRPSERSDERSGVGRAGRPPRARHDAAATEAGPGRSCPAARSSAGRIRTASTCPRPSSSVSSSWCRPCSRSGSA